MTPEQYERFKDFALRMAKTAFRRRRRPNTEWIVEHVEDFIEMIDEDDIVCLRSWDNSDDYPLGHKWYRKGPRNWKCSVCKGVGNLDGDPCTSPVCEDGVQWDYASAPAMTDMMSEWDTERLWQHAYRLATKDEQRRLNYWYDRDIDKYDELREKIVERFENPVHCCIRAALDCVSEPSGGVLGFTACDLRNMYDGTIPDWMNQGWLDGDGHPIDLNAGYCRVEIWL